MKKNKTATVSKVDRRASEIALNHGRAANDQTKADLRRAKREMKPMKITSPGKS
jgi:hypothetical protein